MKRDFDFQRLADIPDPFDDAGAVPPPVAPVAGMPAPTRTGVRSERVAALVAAIAYEAVWLLALHPHAGARTPGMRAADAAIPLFAGIAAFVASTGRGPRGLAQPLTRIIALAAGALAFLTVATMLAPAPADASPAFWPAAITCLKTSAVLTFGPAIAGAWAFRRAFQSAAVWRTAALGIACSAVATLTMSVVCPVASAPHILVGHALILAIAGAVGALVGRGLSRV